MGHIDFPEESVPCDLSGDRAEGLHGKHVTLHADVRRPEQVRRHPRRTRAIDSEKDEKWEIMLNAEEKSLNMVE